MFYKRKVIKDQTLGRILKKKRESLGVSSRRVFEDTGISVENLDHLENDDFSKIPAKVYRQQYLKTYLNYLKLDYAEIKDKLPKNWDSNGNNLKKGYFLDQRVESPKQMKKWNLLNRFNEKSFLYSILGLVLFVVLIFIGYEVRRLAMPPALEIIDPIEYAEIVASEQIQVIGKTEPGVRLLINDQFVPVDNEGNFSYNMVIMSDEDEIIVKAIRKNEKENVVVRKINVLDQE